MITDDYAIQNTAKRIGVKIESAFHEPMGAEREYKFVCSGCGQRYLPGVTKCGICGQDVVKRPV